MNITVRAADIEADRQPIIDGILAHLNSAASGMRFDWLYKNNPFGFPRVWLAVEAEEGTIVGALAAFRRPVYIERRKEVAWVLGDCWVTKRYRSLGPALILQRACLSEIASSAVRFCYDFPSVGMVAVYKRLGFPITGRMYRLAKLLRVDRKIREMVKLPAVDRAVSVIGNTVLKAMSVTRLSDSSMEISTHTGPYGEEFTILDREQQGRLGICTQRSAEYLNWRYLHNPLALHECVTVHRYGKLIGYVIFFQVGEDAVVVDLFGQEDQAMVKGLLSDVAARLTARSVMTLSVWLNEFHPWLSWYEEMGFRVRDSAPIVCIPSSSFANAVNVQSTNWFLMQGDRDS
jgi:hypothetical protein